MKDKNMNEYTIKTRAWKLLEWGNALGELASEPDFQLFPLVLEKAADKDRGKCCYAVLGSGLIQFLIYYI